ncbi:Ankyrin repeat-containing domain [Phytophthora cactorum]|nr:Ankyrin repeat-containing domain [Phytophthora cactorum]
MDPFMWSAYEELCELGANLEASRFFGTANYFDISESMGVDEEFGSRPELSDRIVKSGQQFGDEDDSNAEDRSTDGTFGTPEPPPHFGLGTPKSALSSEFKTSRPLAYKTPNVNNNNNKQRDNIHTATAVKKPRVEDVGAPARQRKAHRRPLADSDEKYRPNARLSFSAAGFDDSPLIPSKLSLGSPTSPLPTRRIYQDKTLVPGSSYREGSSHQVEGQHELLRLLNSFGSIYQKTSVYMCREALEMLEMLPASQRASGWAQQQIGRAYFEMADYVRAQEVFCASHRAEPHRMEGLDLYSQHCGISRRRWSFRISLNKPQTSISYRARLGALLPAKRARHSVGLLPAGDSTGPSFTYAYTLSGHEYVANEDFEKAVNCYRHAIRTDSRHYNAWYEKFEFAEYHFKRALEINPRSSLLHCFLGMVLHATHRYDEALATLVVAAELQPLNPQARFQRANVLITLQRYEEALEELHVVKNFAPRESSVHFMMGKVAKKLGRIEEAMKYFTLALHFHPKDNNQIKMPPTVKAEARLLLHQLTQFEDASEALTRLFEGFSQQDTRPFALAEHARFQKPLRCAGRLGPSGDDPQSAVRGDMELTVLGKPALLFAASIYDEELAMLIWSGFIQFHAGYPKFDLTRQVFDNSADSLGYSALHYAVEAQMGDFIRAVCKELQQVMTASVAGRVVTQDVTLPVNTAQNMGKNIASGGCSLLHLAAKKGELEMVKMFIAPPMLMDPKTLRDWDDNSPARVAAIHGHDEVAAFSSASEVDERRSKREKMARERYLAHMEPHESMLEPSVFENIWTIEETTLVCSEVNRLAAKQGWCKERHASYQTTDMPCHQVAALNSWVRSALADRLFPQIAKRYQLPKTKRLLFRDLFFGERSELALHRDGSVLSFNLLLNSADEFTGGGTYFDATKHTVHITQGDAAVHSGKVLHGGAPVLTGIRQILVGFLDVADCVY